MEISDDVTFDTDAFYALAEGVVAEVIDGEAVLVSFSQARYYACRGLGALVVSALLAGAVSERAFSLQIARAHRADLATARQDVAAFLARLLAEGLIRRAESAAGDVTVPDSDEPYAVAELERHDELSDILALDPIHDVPPDHGWPGRARP
jgi:hypothetical protein